MSSGCHTQQRRPQQRHMLQRHMLQRHMLRNGLFAQDVTTAQPGRDA